jgi:hypothetical protein
VSVAQYSLVLISNPRVNERWDFELLAEHVREIAPDVHTVVLEDEAVDWAGLPGALDLPTLVFSPAPIWNFRAARGTVFQGQWLAKSREYAALESAEVPVPRWALLTPSHAPDLSAFGPYVVVKPDRSGRGADVKIKRKGRVRWRPPETDFTRAQGAEECDWVVQEFVYTGQHPVSYRVVTLFGEPIWAWKVQADLGRRALANRYDFHGGRGASTGGGMSIVASGKGSVFSPAHDEEIFALARRAHSALPDVPLLGVDVLRDSETGDLFVIECNSVGLTWHLTSAIGTKIQQDFDFDLDVEFGARREAARILADAVRTRGR